MPSPPPPDRPAVHGPSWPDGTAPAIDTLRDPATIRARCHEILAAGEDGRLEHFTIDRARLPEVVDAVVRTTRRNYPTLAVPIHGRCNHFRPDGRDRLAELLAGLPEARRGAAALDLVLVSVLLDAGAGSAWRYHEGDRVWARSEGLAIASLHAFAAGSFSAERGDPLRVDADRLRAMTEAELALAFQVGADNPLVGLSGRLALLHGLAQALDEHPECFGANGRPSGLAEIAGTTVHAPVLLRLLLDGLADIWPGRITLGGINLGDVWRHPAAGGEGLTAGLVPLHKLSQWLAYSLVEPLTLAGCTVHGLSALTGLGEYRNGGLLVDLGLLVLRDPEAAAIPLRPEAPLVVEWRALTVACLDAVADGVRHALGLDEAAFPLPCVLEGGSWWAGREAAQARRPGGRPPITIDSDGTVF